MSNYMGKINSISKYSIKFHYVNALVRPLFQNDPNAEDAKNAKHLKLLTNFAST